MELLFTYSQSKEKRNVSGTATLKVFGNKTHLTYRGEFVFDFGHNVKSNIIHELNLNLVSSDFKTTYIHEFNDKVNQNSKDNNFKLLSVLINSLNNGEQGKVFWGSTYRKSVDKISTIFYNKLKGKFKNDYYNLSLLHPKNITGHSFLYRLLVNYHLDINNIKSHDGIYDIIDDNYPSKLWLKRNDNNFLPAVLDSYGIKCKYFIKELNLTHPSPINLKTLRYICHLFGDNYIDYIKQIDWKYCSSYSICFKKCHKLKNDYEKRSMVKLINDLKDNNSSLKSVIQQIHNFLYSMEAIEKLGINIKFKYNNIENFYKTFDELNGLLKHRKRGYRIKYSLPIDFVNMVQEPIISDNKVYKPKILLTEEDFIIEGHIMKNCMSAQFSHAIIFIYISLKSETDTINIQYKNGKVMQARGKANIDINPIFNDAIDILTERLLTNPEIKWIKEKYDFL